MTEIHYITEKDLQFWQKLDKHISKTVLEKKIRDKQGYVIFDDSKPVGVLRYNLFWDNTPFCNMLYIVEEYRFKGFGRLLMKNWEAEMKSMGYGMLMTSTQSDETAQHFYRKLGYIDAGALLINIPKFAQPAELFFIKEI